MLKGFDKCRRQLTQINNSTNRELTSELKVHEKGECLVLVRDGDQDTIFLCGQFFTRRFCRTIELVGKGINNSTNRLGVQTVPAST